MSHWTCSARHVRPSRELRANDEAQGPEGVGRDRGQGAGLQADITERTGEAAKATTDDLGEETRGWEVTLSRPCLFFLTVPMSTSKALSVGAWSGTLGSMPARTRLSHTLPVNDGAATWHGGPSARVRRMKGDDGGCFESALASVRRWGGVLEHPAASAAWAAFGLLEPPRAGGWVVADWFGGWTCCVDQGHYGHRAQKATWLYAVNVPLPILTWGKSSRRVRLDEGFHSAEERRRKIRTGTWQRLSARQRSETPIEFRDVLLSICRA